MRLILFLVSLAFTMPALAQIKRSSSPDGIQSRGDIVIKATQVDVNANASAQDSTVKNTAGAVKSGVQIQGNTTIKATQKNVSGTATGKGSTVTNEAGVVGSK